MLLRHFHKIITETNSIFHSSKFIWGCDTAWDQRFTLKTWPKHLWRLFELLRRWKFKCLNWTHSFFDTCAMCICVCLGANDIHLLHLNDLQKTHLCASPYDSSTSLWRNRSSVFENRNFNMKYASLFRINKMLDNIVNVLNFVRLDFHEKIDV